MNEVIVNLPSKEGFIKFVNSREDDEKVDHIEGVDDCAMGLYWKSLGYSGDCWSMGNCLDWFRSILPFEVFNELNLSRVNTYGELSVLLKENP